MQPLVRDSLTLIIAAAAVLLTSVSFIRGAIEYRKQGLTKRAELFLTLRTRLREDATFARICDRLESDDEELRNELLVDKDRFIGFFEELALFCNSRLIRDHVAFYMFG